MRRSRPSTHLRLTHDPLTAFREALTSMNRFRWKSTLNSIPFLFLLSSMGCSGGDSFYPAQGKVLLGDKPAEGVTLLFIPGPGAKDDGTKPSAKTGPDGSFTVKTFDASTRTIHEGARAGNYTVLVTWIPDVTAASLDKGISVGDKLANRYGNTATSPFKVEIKPGPNDLPPIKLAESDVRKGSR